MLKDLIRSMRPRQWPKNAFVFAGLVFDGQLSLSAWGPLIRVTGAFIIFCLLSSAVYLVNDIRDAPGDRLHPTKSSRPIAAGQLSPLTAGLAAGFLVIAGLLAAGLLSTHLLWVSLAYLSLNVFYTLWLKTRPILDVISLAAGFVLRVLAGVVVIHVQRFSPWLYLATTLLALFIGFGKRRAEIILLEGGAEQARKVLSGYSVEFLDHVITVVSSSTIITYSLYTFLTPNLPEQNLMMLTIPFVLYGVFRYLYLIHVRKMGGAPEELLWRDRPLQAVILLWALSVFSVIYLVR